MHQKPIALYFYCDCLMFDDDRFDDSILDSQSPPTKPVWWPYSGNGPAHNILFRQSTENSGIHAHILAIAQNISLAVSQSVNAFARSIFQQSVNQSQGFVFAQITSRTDRRITVDEHILGCLVHLNVDVSWHANYALHKQRRPTKWIDAASKAGILHSLPDIPRDARSDSNDESSSEESSSDDN